MLRRSAKHGVRLPLKLQADLAVAALRLALPGALDDPLHAVRRLPMRSMGHWSLSYRQAENLAQLTDRLARLVRPSLPCLPRAILRYRALRTLGEPAVLHVGLAASQGEVIGHAWVSIGGVPFFEEVGPLGAYRTFVSYPADGQ